MRTVPIVAGTGGVLAALILDDLAWARIGRGFGVVALFGVVMVAMNVRTIRAYD